MTASIEVARNTWAILHTRASAVSPARRAAAPELQPAADAIASAERALAIAPKPMTTAKPAKPIKSDREKQIDRALSSALPTRELIALLRGPAPVLEAALQRVGA